MSNSSHPSNPNNLGEASPAAPARAQDAAAPPPPSAQCEAPKPQPAMVVPKGTTIEDLVRMGALKITEVETFDPFAPTNIAGELRAVDELAKHGAPMAPPPRRPTRGPLDLLVRTADGSELVQPPSFDLYVWSSRIGMLEDIRFARDEIEAIKPDRIILHGNPSEIKTDGPDAIKLAIEIMGSADRVGLGIGGDGWGEEWRRGHATSEQVIRPLLAAVTLGYSRGVRLFVPNLEAAWKRHNNPKKERDVRSIEELVSLMEAIADAFAVAAPKAVFALSSYDQPTLHSALKTVYAVLTKRWPLITGQVYTAVPGVPSRMALPARLAAFAKSFNQAGDEGWVTRDELMAEVSSDCDRVPTFQGHKVDPRALCKAIVESPHCFVWSAPSIVDENRREDGRLDAVGVNAATAAAKIRALGFIGPDAIKRFQAAKLLSVDGNPGRQVFASLGLSWLDYA